jgi:hypothetical protein
MGGVRKLEYTSVRRSVGREKERKREGRKIEE